MLNKILKDYNLNLKQIDDLNYLKKIVLEYNKHTNLTSITDEEEFDVKHILDSISINKYFDLNNKNILDVGSGGGFPGLVLAIVLPTSKITMIDSNNKKIEFIKMAGNKLGLKNFDTIYSRVEEAKILEKYDFIISRAVASLNVLLEITAFSSKINGKIVFYKGSNLDKEIPSSWDYVESELGLKFDKIISFELSKNIERSFISFYKFKKTKEKYPRIYSTIKNTPLY